MPAAQVWARAVCGGQRKHYNRQLQQQRTRGRHDAVCVVGVVGVGATGVCANSPERKPLRDWREVVWARMRFVVAHAQAAHTCAITHRLCHARAPAIRAAVVAGHLLRPSGRPVPQFVQRAWAVRL